MYLQNNETTTQRSMSHKCDKCEKEFVSKHLLTRHEKRKTPCSKNEGFACTDCGQRFNNRIKLHDHITEAHNVFDPSGTSPPAPSSAIAALAAREERDAKADKRVEQDDLLKDKETLLDELRQIRKIVRAANISPPSSSTTKIKPLIEDNPQDTITTTPSEPVKAPHTEGATEEAIEAPRLPTQFGRESQEYFENLDFDDIKKELKLTPTLDTVFAMIKLININSAHPENRNVKLDSSDDEKVKIYKRGQWRSEDTRETILNMIGRNRLRFYDIEHLLSRNMRKKSLQCLDQFLDEVEDVANKNKEADEDFESLIEDIKEELYKASLVET